MDKQFDLMWSMLQFGKQKSNIPALKELCSQLRKAMLQKTAGQQPYHKIDDVDFDDVPTIINCIAIETMCLYLSGDLDKVEEDSIPHATWSEDMKLVEDAFGDRRCGFQCSRCKAIVNKTKYCGNCGAIMKNWIGE